MTEKNGCLSIFLPLLGRSKKKTAVKSIESDFLSATNETQEAEKPSSKPLPYRLRDDFLSSAEFSFYKVLLSVVGRR